MSSGYTPIASNSVDQLQVAVAHHGIALAILSWAAGKLNEKNPWIRATVIYLEFNSKYPCLALQGLTEDSDLSIDDVEREADALIQDARLIDVLDFIASSDQSWHERLKTLPKP